MLRVFESFSESAPQIVLMTSLIIEMQELQPFTVIKILGSLSALTFTVLSYHRNMRVFVPQKFKMGWTSSVIYFMWNLLLIGPRVVCLSLFASILPCYVPAHFLSLWTLLVVWAWWQNTDFMDTKSGEWLYRATVGLIWYFSWFNVTSGNTKHKGIIYHMVMMMDMLLLLGLWWWRTSVESARSPLNINPYLIIAMLMSMYIIGILLKLVYYWKFHPKKPILQIDQQDQEPQMKLERDEECSSDLMTGSDESPEPEPEPEPKPKCTVLSLTQSNLIGIHKRIRNMAGNFYY